MFLLAFQQPRTNRREASAACNGSKFQQLLRLQFRLSGDRGSMASNGSLCLSSHAYIDINGVKEARIFALKRCRLSDVLQAKSMHHDSSSTETSHHLFGSSIKRFHIDVAKNSPTFVRGTVKSAQNDNQRGDPNWRCVLLDIEGTTTPISFVTDVLFPYAHENVRNHLSVTYDSKETQDDITLIREQVKEDIELGVPGSQHIPSEDAGKEKVIDALAVNVEAMIKADRKVTALKQLQGHIWRTGFDNNELKGRFFEDVPKVLVKWHAMGIKVYIYSSGSREAQRLIFGNTTNKREIHNYIEIWHTLGVDKPSEILFVTDVIQEADAAGAAGLQVLIAVRPGNAPLPGNHSFRTILSFDEI